MAPRKWGSEDQSREEERRDVCSRHSPVSKRKGHQRAEGDKKDPAKEGTEACPAPR